MASISDIIENFILKTLGDDDSVDISRNELASFFSCAPSQINYVLETRFTIDRGFLKESHRGGGGFIKISKVKLEDDNYIKNLVLESVGDELNQKRMCQIIDRLTREEVITEKEAGMIKICLSDDSLSMPFVMRDRVRAKAFKAVLVHTLKYDNETDDCEE